MFKFVTPNHRPRQNHVNTNNFVTARHVIIVAGSPHTVTIRHHQRSSPPSEHARHHVRLNWVVVIIPLVQYGGLKVITACFNNTRTNQPVQPNNQFNNNNCPVSLGVQPSRLGHNTNTVINTVINLPRVSSNRSIIPGLGRLNRQLLFNNRHRPHHVIGSVIRHLANNNSQ
jgi:heme/copper-type cytochrome/quinol oxidase subunit 2